MGSDPLRLAPFLPAGCQLTRLSRLTLGRWPAGLHLCPQAVSSQGDPCEPFDIDVDFLGQSLFDRKVSYLSSWDWIWCQTSYMKVRRDLKVWHPFFKFSPCQSFVNHLSDVFTYHLIVPHIHNYIVSFSWCHGVSEWLFIPHKLW